MKSRWSRAQQVVLLALLSLFFIEVPILMNCNSVRSVSQGGSVTAPRTAIKQNGQFNVAADEVYTEDFTSTAYLDAAHTNASGWGTGSLALPRLGPFVTGSCATPSYSDTYPEAGVYVSGDYAYVVDKTSGLQVINITDAYHPALVGAYNPPSNIVATSVHVSGDYAYVAAYNIGLMVVNITDPTHPSLAGNCTLPNQPTPSYAQGVYVSGDYAYIADGPSGLRVVNITDSIHPSLVGSLACSSDAYGVCVSGDYAYVADLLSGLEVVNITVPTAPSLASSLSLGYSNGVYVAGDYAYVANDGSGLAVVNITDPTSLSLVGSCATPGDADGVYIEGDYAYVADSTSGLQVVNITDPTDPSLVGSCATHDLALGVYVSGDYAYIADAGYGLQVVRIADFTPPSSVGSYATSSAECVDVSGDYAYVTDTSLGLLVVNITDPTHPSLVGSCVIPGIAFELCVRGHYAYVAAANAGLQVVNITNPTHPSIAGSCVTSTAVHGVDVSGDCAYLAGNSGLLVVDITDPTQPFQAGSCSTLGRAFGVCVSGNYAYIADYDQGLQVANITDPAHPSVVGSCVAADAAEDVHVSGDYAYVAYYGLGLQVVNITDPTNPSLAGSCATPGSSWSVCVSGDYAYIADADSGLQIVNITDPTHPSIAGSCATPSTAYWIHVSGDYAYVADSTSVQVIEVQRNYCREYALSAMAQSLIVYDGYSVSHATVQATGTQPLGTSATYYLSADGGLHWEAVTSGVEHTFVNSGTQLCWRAVLSTTDSIQSPILSGLSIAYNIRLAAPIQTSPGYGLLTRDTTPTLQWTDTYVGVSYLVQVDTVASFDSINLINITVPVGTKSCVTPALVDGLWYWRVAANDTSGDLGLFSGPWSLTVDTTAPTWDQTPTSKVVEFLTSFSYDLHVSDPSGISKWWTNDTAHFAIDSSGVITNTTPLAVGVYGIQVWVNDTVNNVQTAKFSVTVQDTTSPSWVEEPTGRTVEFLTPLRYKLNASDPSGISKWWTNDTAHFDIDSSGVMANATTLAVGVYNIQVWVNDSLNNVQTAEFFVVVQDTTPPYWIVQPTDVILDYGKLLDYQLQVADFSGIKSYRINDTIHFSINATGHITSETLDPGTYGVLVTVVDPYGNYLTGEFTVTVLEQQTTTTTTTITTTTTTTSAPTTTTSTAGIPLDFGTRVLILGGLGAVVVIVVVLVYMKRRPS